MRHRTLVATAKAAHLCRRPGCQRIGDHARGLCESHYRLTAYYVSKGLYKWSVLERQGKVAATQPTLKEWLDA